MPLFKWILGLLAAAVLLLVFHFEPRVSRSLLFKASDQIGSTKGANFSAVRNVTDQPSTGCRVPKLDPWDPSVTPLLKPEHNPWRSCTPSYERRSQVEDGLLRVDQTSFLHAYESCSFRCLLPVDDWTLQFGEWLPVGANGSRPECDVFEVQCTLLGFVTYKFLHMQIHEQPPPEVKPPAGSSDVHMLLLDSVSMSQFFRSMPKTTEFLRKEMDAVVFPFANKVGVNSRPNAYGFLVGERAENSLPNPWGTEQLGGRLDELCGQPMEKENVVFFDYRNGGYRTMMVEDWRAHSFLTLSLCRFFQVRWHFHVNAAEWNKTTDFSNSTYEHANRTLLGSSLCRPLPQPRTCDSMHIPFQFCLCQHEFSLIKDETIALRVAELAVAKMNEAVVRSEFREKCGRLSVDREHTARTDIQEFEPQGERRIFRVNFRVQPSGGLYDAFAEMTGDSIRLITERFPRHDRYEHQARCIPENFIRNYCFCPPPSSYVQVPIFD
ncbi:hypothetical protein M3Y99_01575600 [Aphelenchoides fujianensis]|nr:hypothetical protein M3Y99_01575600 [Aphelenchoides fujianensis]